MNIYHQVLIVVHLQLNITGNTNKPHIFLNTETNHQWFDHNKKLPNALTLLELVKTKEWSPILVILARKAQENVVFVWVSFFLRECFGFMFDNIHQRCISWKKCFLPFISIHFKVTLCGFLLQEMTWMHIYQMFLISVLLYSHVIWLNINNCKYKQLVVYYGRLYLLG